MIAQAVRQLPDMLADASLVLYMTARPLLDSAYCRRDKEALLVMEVLWSLHTCFEVWMMSQLFDCSHKRIWSWSGSFTLCKARIFTAIHAH
jgi:hypothetical protein